MSEMRSEQDALLDGGVRRCSCGEFVLEDERHLRCETQPLAFVFCGGCKWQVRRVMPDGSTRIRCPRCQEPLRG